MKTAQVIWKWHSKNFSCTQILSSDDIELAQLQCDIWRAPLQLFVRFSKACRCHRCRLAEILLIWHALRDSSKSGAQCLLCSSKIVIQKLSPEKSTILMLKYAKVSFSSKNSLWYFPFHIISRRQSSDIGICFWHEEEKSMLCSCAVYRIDNSVIIIFNKHVVDLVPVLIGVTVERVSELLFERKLIKI